VDQTEHQNALAKQQ